jgi:hypothetical protein
MEATAGASRTLFLLTPSAPLVRTVRLAIGVGRRRLVAAGGRKRRGKDGDAGEERVDSHSFNPKAGEVTGPFPESVLLRKVRASRLWFMLRVVTLVLKSVVNWVYSFVVNLWIMNAPSYEQTS